MSVRPPHGTARLSLDGLRKIYVHSWSYIVSVIRRFINDWDKSCRENQNTLFLKIKSCRLCDNVEKCCRAGLATGDNAIRRMSIAYRITKATDTESEYVILTDFPLQQWLHNARQCYVTPTLPVLFFWSPFRYSDFGYGLDYQRISVSSPIRGKRFVFPPVLTGLIIKRWNLMMKLHISGLKVLEGCFNIYISGG